MNLREKVFWHVFLLLVQGAAITFFTFWANLPQNDARKGHQFKGHFLVYLIFLANAIFFIVTDERQLDWKSFSKKRGYIVLLSASLYALLGFLLNDWHGSPPHDFLRWGHHVNFCFLLMQCGIMLIWASKKNWKDLANMAEALMLISWAMFGIVHLQSTHISKVMHLVMSTWSVISGLGVIFRKFVLAGAAYFFAAYAVFGAQMAACQFYIYQAAEPLSIVSLVHVIPICFMTPYILLFRDEGGYLKVDNGSDLSHKNHDQELVLSEDIRLMGEEKG
mmetsp:Transcript_23539/g.35223  ORF Transcript_23539/g.35223 Transcript_23539/m.35223 type:complete len:277 (-) Transcript_23539:162-992(-)